MALLITGASGFLGTALTDRLLAKGNKVISISRHPPKIKENLIALRGDILEPDLGAAIPPEEKIDAVYHLAAVHNLGRDKDGSIWRTNVEGTKNVILFCTQHAIPHLYFCSTAYTQQRNTYEKSKALGELLVKESDIPHITIFKPSIIMGSPQHFFPGHFCQLVSILIQVHQRAETIRRKIEGTLRLPVLEPIFRFRANRDGKLNLVPVEIVADAMASIDKSGTYWLTHPNPPTIAQLVEWVSEFIMVRLEISTRFKPTPLEAIFYRIAQPFLPYLIGDDFNSDLKDCPPITKETIYDSLSRMILG